MDKLSLKLNNDLIFYNDMQRIKSLLLMKEIPDAYPEDVSRILSLPFGNPYYVDRFEFINLSSFALVSERWVKPLAEFIGGRACLEIMAGKGVLSKCLNSHGVRIIATDDYSWNWHRSRDDTGGRRVLREELWFDVRGMDCETAIDLYGADCGFVICSMPPYKDASLRRALLRMRQVNGRCRLIYIGEPKGGMNADAGFFDTTVVVKNDAKFNRIAGLYQHWCSMNDRLWLME